MCAYMNEQMIAHSNKSFIYAYLFHVLLNNEGESIHCSWAEDELLTLHSLINSPSACQKYYPIPCPTGFRLWSKPSL